MIAKKNSSRDVSFQHTVDTTAITATQAEDGGSGSPVVAALRERMAAVKEKQNFMEMFSPVRPTGGSHFFHVYVCLYECMFNMMIN